MAQVKLLKVGTDGVPTEFNSTTDDITLDSFTVQGGGPSLSPTGLAMSNLSITGLANITFTNPAVDVINQTSSNLIINNIMGKDRTNAMALGSSINFGTITDTSANDSSFQLPQLAGIPTATPTSGSGQLVYDATDDAIYLYNGTKWRNLNDTTDAQSIDDFYTAAVSLTATQAVYLSAADAVSPGNATGAVSSQVLGFAVTGAAASATNVRIRKFGKLPGFTGLTAGARYYLDTATAGNIVTTVPILSGATIVQVGYAKNATTLDIQVEQLGRRA